MRATTSVFLGRRSIGDGRPGIFLDFDVIMADGSVRRVSVSQMYFLQHRNEGVMRQAEQADEPIITVNENDQADQERADMKAHHPIHESESYAVVLPPAPVTINDLEREAQQMNTRRKGRQGFASMDKDKHRSIASAGGKAAHEKGTGHEWTREEAKIYGAMGGRAKKKSQ